MTNTIEVLYTVLEVVIAVACCLGNLLVIWAVWKCGAMRRQPTFCFIVSLAVADFLVGAVAIPLAVLVDGRVRTSFYGCVTLCSVVVILPLASIHSLMAIALDRFLRVYIPHRYKRIATEFHSWSIVGVCWFCAGVLGFIPMFGWYRHDTLSQMEASNATSITCTFLAVIPMPYMVHFIFFSCLLTPMLLMMALYLYIFRRIHLQLRGRGRGVGGSESRSYYQRERKLTQSLVVILVLFAVSWLPLHFMNTVSFYGCIVPHQAFYVGILLSHANSAVNPIVYALRIHKIKSAFKMAWCRYVLCTEYQETPASSQVTENINSSSTTRN